MKAPFQALWAASCTLALLSRRGVVAQSNDACSPACANGGKCTPQFNSPGYYCECAGTGFVGPTCEAANSSSSIAPSTTSSGNTGCSVACQNGSCTPQFNSNEYYCKCSPGFSGPACNISSAPSMAPPVSSSCPIECNNGKCVPQFNSNGYTCLCNPGYNGLTCSQSTAVTPSTSSTANENCPVSCYNGACKQTTNSNTYFCECTPEYRGISCAIPVPATAPTADESSASTNVAPSTCPVPCSSHGTCRPQFNSMAYECHCDSGWNGTACDFALSPLPGPASVGVNGNQYQNRDQPATPIKGWVVLVIILAVVAAFVLAGGIGFIVYRRKRSNKTFVRFDDSTFEPQQVEVLGRKNADANSSLRSWA